MNFDLLCEESIQEINKNKEILNRIESNPEVILTDIFKGQGCYNYLTDTIETFGKKYTIHNFQNDLYELLIPFLKEKLGEDYEYSKNENSYPSSLIIKYKKYNLIHLNIYNQVINIFNPLMIDIYESRLQSYENNLEKKRALLDRIQKAGLNPFKICNNPIELLTIIFQLSKYKKRSIEYAEKLKGDIEYYNMEIDKTKGIIKEQKEIKPEIEDRTQKLIEFFKQYGFNVIFNHI
jgi:hypothetical protein